MFGDDVLLEKELQPCLSPGTEISKRIRSLTIYSPPGNVGLCQSEHVQRGLVELDEDTVVDLQQAEQLQHLAGLGVKTVDTVRGKKGAKGYQIAYKIIKIIRFYFDSSYFVDLQQAEQLQHLARLGMQAVDMVGK